MKTIVAKLIIGKEERELSWVDLDYYRRVKPNGKPCSRAEGGFIAMRFAPQSNDDFFLEWMFADRMEDAKIDPRFQYYTTKDGAVVFYEGDFEGRVLFKYEFEEGVPIHYQEAFSNEWGMEVFMVISAPIQKFRSKEPFVKLWYEKWSPPKEKEKAEKEEAPELKELYYTNEQGERITEDELKPGTIIYLNIIGNYLSGKKGDLNLKDDNVDFEYNGKHLTDDVLEDYTFNSDNDRVELKVVEQKTEE